MSIAPIRPRIKVPGGFYRTRESPVSFFFDGKTMRLRFHYSQRQRVIEALACEPAG